MFQTDEETLQRICEEVEAESPGKFAGLAIVFSASSHFAKAVARRYAETVAGPDQWRAITESDKIGRLRTRLLIARYPQSRGWTDAYAGWWDPKDRKWVRWPHEFPPTHCMDVSVPADGPPTA